MTSTEAVHAAGPWRVGFSDGSGPECITAANDTIVVVRGGDSFGLMYGVERPADRHLIAAAPRMLAALKAHDRYMSKHFRDGPDSSALRPDAKANWKRVRSAISKSQGVS